MSNTSHTPGPWTILGADYAEGTHVSIVPPNAAQVASVKKFDNWQANARLIAAAPDVLAALQLLQDAALPISRGGDVLDEKGFNTLAHPISVALAAIAKATQP